MKKRIINSIKILVRFDDICPTMNYTEFQKALTVIEKYDIKPLLGIIPNCQDPELQIEAPHEDFWDFMRQLQCKGFSLAMHGFLHKYDNQNRGIVNMGFKSEFSGHSYEEQYRRIKEGKQILSAHGIETDIFFAPAHSYDVNTLKALSANGFRYVSDGMSAKMMCREGIICVPCRSTGCPPIKGKGHYTAVFHAHEWVRPDKKEGYNQLVNLCRDYNHEIVNFQSYVDRPLGSTSIQILDEIIYVNYVRYLKPKLSRIKHSIFK